MLKGCQGDIRQQSRYEVAVGYGRHKEPLPSGESSCKPITVKRKETEIPYKLTVLRTHLSYTNPRTSKPVATDILSNLEYRNYGV